MNFARRHFIQFVGAAAAAPILPRFAFAQAYPTRPVRIIVPYGAGTVPDVVTRLLGQALSERLGQPFIIENRPGAGGSIGTEAVVRAAADGYTLLSIAGGNYISPSLFDKLSFNFIRDIAPIASHGRYACVISVHPSIPVHSIPELIAYARANPGQLSEGSLTAGPIHLASEWFKMMTGVNIVHVPYRSGALADLLSGRLTVSFDTVGVLAESIRAGKVRGLAVTTATQWAGLPEVPTVGEFVQGFEVNSPGGFGAPKDTPREIVDVLNKEINIALADSKMRGRIVDLGGTTLASSPAEFGKIIADETEKWARVIRAANIKPE
jgi:tripartite-type tricarboxylate transporter receptor subunit TctC